MTFEGYLYHKDSKMDKVSKQELVFWFAIFTAIISSMVLWFNKDLWQLKVVNYVFIPTTIISYLIAAITKFLGWNKKDPINGVIRGVIRISPESIEIEKDIYQIDTIQNLNIVLRSFSGKFLGRSNYPGPQRSNGVQNHISFCYHGKTIHKDFLIQSEFDYDKLKAIKKEIKKTANY